MSWMIWWRCAGRNNLNGLQISCNGGFHRLYRLIHVYYPLIITSSHTYYIKSERFKAMHTLIPLYTYAVLSLFFPLFCCHTLLKKQFVHVIRSTFLYTLNNLNTYLYSSNFNLQNIRWVLSTQWYIFFWVYSQLNCVITSSCWKFCIN